MTGVGDTVRVQDEHRPSTRHIRPVPRVDVVARRYRGNAEIPRPATSRRVWPMNTGEVSNG